MSPFPPAKNFITERGYKTAMFGKLHFVQQSKGFDEFKILTWSGDYYNPRFNYCQLATRLLPVMFTDITTTSTMDFGYKNRRMPKTLYVDVCCTHAQ